ncbi:COG2426 family protein [Chloroflexota bacterium]
MSLQELINLGIPSELIIIILSAMPISELRGAIPVAINLLHFPWYYAFLVALIGNLLPVPFILLLLTPVSRALSRVKVFERIFSKLFEHAGKRGKVIEKYERIGLTLFVAIPLPITGAWTGSIAAALFRLKFAHALVSILIGIIISGAIVTALCLLGWIGAAIAGVGLGALAIFSLWKA